METKQFLLWLPMIAIAFLNGTIRQLFFVRSMSELRAHQLSTVTLIVFCSIYIWSIFPVLKVLNSKQAFLIGLTWMILTVAFEFLLGRLTNKPWAYLLQDYNIATGHIWPLFLICLFLLPWVCYVIRK